LKPTIGFGDTAGVKASPDLTAGRGLKHGGISDDLAWAGASPDLTAGRGLKQLIASH